MHTAIVDAVTTFGACPGRDVDWSLETLLSLLDRHGVEKAFSLSLKGIHYDFEEGNDETLQASKRHPVLEPVATIDPRRHLGCADEIAKRVDQGFRLFGFFPSEQGWPLNFLPFRRLLEHLAEHDVRLLLPAAGAGTPTLIHDTLAGYEIPTLLTGAGYSIMAELMAVLQANPRFHTDLHLLDTHDGVDLLAAEVGVERLMFGSDVPQRYFESALGLVTASHLSGEAKQAILRENALRFLGS
jgi:predicted TIM-barrel fold metal-dependent hydrolase